MTWGTWFFVALIAAIIGGIVRKVLSVGKERKAQPPSEVAIEMVESMAWIAGIVYFGLMR